MYILWETTLPHFNKSAMHIFISLGRYHISEKKSDKVWLKFL